MLKFKVYHKKDSVRVVNVYQQKSFLCFKFWWFYSTYPSLGLAEDALFMAKDKSVWIEYEL